MKPALLHAKHVQHSQSLYNLDPRPMIRIPFVSFAATRTAICLALFSLASPVVAQTLVYEGSEGIGKGKHIVFIANDHEYRSEQTCPLLAKILAKHYGFRCTVLFGIGEDGTIQSGGAPIPGIEALRDADLLFFFTRFMNLPDEQAEELVNYFERGGPVVGVRTSTHCFNGQQGKWEKLNFRYAGEDYRGGLGEQIFGNTWDRERGQSHYGSNHQMGGTVRVIEGVKHPIVKGLSEFHTYSGAYKSQPPADATPLLEIQVLNTFGPSGDINTEKPIVNVGWTRKSYTAPSGDKKNARVVYASFGASEDMLVDHARRFLVHSCLWAVGLEKEIKRKMDVSIVGTYSPSPYNGGAFYYEGVKPADLAGWESQIMPTSAPLAGVGDPKSVAKRLRVLQNRPYLKAQLAKQYPDLYGPDAKLPPAPAKKKRK